MKATVGKIILLSTIAIIFFALVCWYFIDLRQPSKNKTMLMEGASFNELFENENVATVIFGVSSNYTNEVLDATVVEHEGGSSIKIYKKAGSVANTIDVFVLSEYQIIANKDCSKMFRNFTSLTSVVFWNFDTSKVRDMSRMFINCTSLEYLDLSRLNTNSVTTTADMFLSCSNLQTIHVSSNFKTTQVEDSTNMFFNCTSLVGGSGTAYNSQYVDKLYARVDAIDAPGYFTLKTAD